VSCTAAKDCVAVGVGVDGAHGGLLSFVEFWDGKTWTATSVPPPGKGKASLFSEVSCPAAGGYAAGRREGRPERADLHG
jgi:hypothetical protein